MRKLAERIVNNCYLGGSRELSERLANTLWAIWGVGFSVGIGLGTVFGALLNQMVK